MTTTIDAAENAEVLPTNDAEFNRAEERTAHNYHPLPVVVAHAEGAWMTDVDGRRYLDAYNNVPCVGHGHPRVTEAIARQTRRLNTNLRYLHEGAVVLAEGE